MITLLSAVGVPIKIALPVGLALDIVLVYMVVST
jgi:hypothetical protein